jgi:hypothetical protein
MKVKKKRKEKDKEGKWKKKIRKMGGRRRRGDEGRRRLLFK